MRRSGAARHRRFGEAARASWLADLTLIVGANNAGKSTIVEALRLIAIVATRYRSLAFRAPPVWLPENEAAPGVSPSLEGTGIELSTVIYQYEDPPASVRSTFASGATVVVFLGPEGELDAVIRASDGSLVMDRAGAYRVDLASVASQPQVAPLVRNEALLMRDTAMRNLSSTLARFADEPEERVSGRGGLMNVLTNVPMDLTRRN